ncbi:MAG: sensor histidine kinase [Sphingobacteriaceae bacterium]
MQNRQGAVYISHEEGISRYNGRTFKHFKNPGIGKSLSDPVETEEGSILTSSFYGDIVKIEGDSITLLKIPFTDSSKRRIFRKCGNRIFLNSQNQLFEFRYKTFKEIKFSNANQNKLWILDIISDDENNVYILYTDDKQSHIVKLNENNKVVNDTHFPFQINNKSFLIKLGNETFLFNIETKTFHSVISGKLSPVKAEFIAGTVKWLKAFNIDKELFCITGYDGLLLFNKRGKVINHFLKGIPVSGICRDIEGNLWISTLSAGVYLFPDLNIKELNLNNYIGENDFIKSSCIVNKRMILLGTNKGKLLKINTVDERIDFYDHELKGDVQSVYYDSAAKLIYAYCDALYVLNDKDLKTVSKYKITSTKDIKVIDKRIYCATSSNLNNINGNKEITYFNGAWINSILHDPVKNELLMGSNKGLLILDLTNHKEGIATIPIEGIDNSLITELQTDNRGNIYMLANNLGIIKRNQDIYKLIFKSQNIRKFRIFKNKLYIIYKEKVCIHDLNTLKIIYTLDVTKAMDDDVLNVAVFGEQHLIVHPRKIKLYSKLLPLNTKKPTIIPLNTKGTYKKQKNNDYYSEYKNNLEFQLEILPNIRTANTFKLYYRVKEIDGEWVLYNNESNDLRFKYQQINSGDYHFEAYAVNEDGLKSEIFKLNFKIDTPYWKKWWFITSVALAISIILMALYLKRIRDINKAARVKLDIQNTKIKLLSAELTAIRSQMNPHFIFNTLSSIQAKVLTSKGDEAYNDISRFSQLIRSVLNYSSTEFILLADEIEFIKNYLYLESSRFEGKINYKIEIDTQLDIHFLEIPTLITIPFIENAIIHGLMHLEGNKQLTISFNEITDGLKITIRDNGIGRIRSSEINKKSGKKHKSFAMDATKKRIDRINESGHMKLKLNINDLEVGTEIELLINYN